MSKYTEKFKDPHWQKKRLEILNRDNWTCRNCKSKDNTLNVHHITYSTDFDNPWEYPEYYLMTLCDECHEHAHNNPLYLPVHMDEYLWADLFSSEKIKGLASMELDKEGGLWDNSISEFWGPLV